MTALYIILGLLAHGVLGIITLYLWVLFVEQFDFKSEDPIVTVVFCLVLWPLALFTMSIVFMIAVIGTMVSTVYRKVTNFITNWYRGIKYRLKA